jgi:signal transduction histidine kinase
MITIRHWAVYVMLAAVWGALIGWQAAEHVRLRKEVLHHVTDRGRFLSSACGRLMRPRRFLGGVVNRERLEAALNTLVDTNELLAVELLNNADEVVASAGLPIRQWLSTGQLPPRDQFNGGVYWGGGLAILKYPMDLGTNMVPELVIPYEELLAMRTNREAADTNRPPPGFFGPPGRPPPEFFNSTNRPPPGFFNPTNRPPPPPDLRTERPYWMKEEDYKALLKNKSAHTFVVVMSAQPVVKAENDDLWMRLIIAFLGTAATVGFAVTWRSLVKTSELQLRLVRASEQNLHLKELNLAAAGLAHETRNPLNIIRGLAQLIAKHDQTPPDICAKSREIINETDRVTAQLNEFINYSRPREVRRAATDLSAVAGEVARALNYDLEEKKIKLELLVERVIIEADEQLLRQALFNLVLNAIQAAPAQGAIRLRASRRSNQEAFIEISDNGPGVPPENRSEIFKPYFTTHPEGTGLGLSVVQQIILAHGWEIQCLPNEPAGALFRISHVKIKE